MKMKKENLFRFFITFSFLGETNGALSRLNKKPVLMNGFLSLLESFRAKIARFPVAVIQITCCDAVRTGMDELVVSDVHTHV